MAKDNILRSFELLVQAKEREEELRKKLRCPYRQDLNLWCMEDCGRGLAVDCPIYMKESRLLAEALAERG